MTVYRACCREEAEATLSAGAPAFLRRWKWFSPDRDFVTERVQDGRFNRSDVKPARYTVLLRLEIAAGDDKFIKRNREWALDRRLANSVRWGIIVAETNHYDTRA